MELRFIFFTVLFALATALPPVIKDGSSNSVLSAFSKESPKPTAEDLYWGLEVAKDEYVHPGLPFPAEALEPYIDKATMEIHHAAIFKEYTIKLNDLLKRMRNAGGKTKELAKTSLINIWRNRNDFPNNNMRQEFSYYGGGYMNHILYFSTMSPNPKDEERKPSEKMTKLIERSFHNMTMMKKDVNMLTKEMFGSGWVYVALATGYSSGQYLTVMSSVEEYLPLDSKGIYPILALDLWEHAYFKKYGNTRRDYVKNWWMTVDWVKVEKLLNWWGMVEPDTIKHLDL